MGRLLDLAHAVSVPNEAENTNTNNMREKRKKGLLPNLNADLTHLHDNLIRLRIGDPPKGTRAQAFSYQAQQIEKLAALSQSIEGTSEGWPDACDPFTDLDQITALRQAMAEVESGPYPAPLPEGCTLLPQADFDVFGAGRRYNGR